MSDKSAKSNLILGVGGGIAAFKAAALASQLVQAGYSLRVAMTPDARQFIGSKTFAGLTGTQTILSSTQVDADGTPPHIAATKDARLMILAPATADLMARLAAGACADAVSLLALVASCPKLLCPAMNDAMWESAVVQRNLKTLQGLGYQVLGPVLGHLAEGYDAVGRMVEPEEIVAEVGRLLGGKGKPGK